MGHPPACSNECAVLRSTSTTILNHGAWLRCEHTLLGSVKENTTEFAILLCMPIRQANLSTKAMQSAVKHHQCLLPTRAAGPAALSPRSSAHSAQSPVCAHTSGQGCTTAGGAMKPAATPLAALRATTSAADTHASASQQPVGRPVSLAKATHRDDVVVRHGNSEAGRRRSAFMGGTT